MVHACQILDHVVLSRAVIYQPDGQEECIKNFVPACGSILLGDSNHSASNGASSGSPEGNQNIFRQPESSGNN